jgi:nucleotide-binding universal stress UspA family protein
MNEIIVGVDGGEAADVAARTAATLAKECGRPLHVVMAIKKHTSSHFSTGGSDNWQIDSLTDAVQSLASITNVLRGDTEVTSAVIVDDPATALCTEAERLGASIIVVGNRRVKGISRVLGSVATEVARQAPCDVLIAHTT